MFLNKFFKKLFSKKSGISERKKELLEQYEKGLILQVDNEKNNKEYFDLIKNEK